MTVHVQVLQTRQQPEIRRYGTTQRVASEVYVLHTGRQGCRHLRDRARQLVAAQGQPRQTRQVAHTRRDTTPQLDPGRLEHHQASQVPHTSRQTTRQPTAVQYERLQSRKSPHHRRQCTRQERQRHRRDHSGRARHSRPTAYTCHGLPAAVALPRIRTVVCEACPAAHCLVLHHYMHQQNKTSYTHHPSPAIGCLPAGSTGREVGNTLGHTPTTQPQSIS